MQATVFAVGANEKSVKISGRDGLTAMLREHSIRCMENVELVGRLLGNYRVLQKLGSGGMGAVYLAEDVRLDRQVALKVLLDESLLDEDSVQRFRREARAASSVSHPHICTVYDTGEEDGLPFLVMELLDGQTLAQLIATGPLSAEQFLPLAVQVCEALQYAHEKGIVHRDLKPSNIFVTARGDAKLLDFGLAKVVASVTDEDVASTALTRVGEVLGTVPYMSPEQAEGKALDGRSDLFSLGTVFYEMVTGARAFRGSNPATILADVVRGEPRAVRMLNPETPAELQRIISKLLEKQPAERYQSAKEVTVDLRRLAKELAMPTAKLERSGRVRNWKMWAAAGAVSVLCLIAAGLAFWKHVPAQNIVRAIAVLPLDNFSGDTNQAYFADGVTDAITTELAQVGALRIASRTSASKYRGGTVSISQIAHDLNVDAVVQGSVARQGDHVRVTAQLIAASDDRNLWANTYDRKVDDVLTLESEVARDIAAHVKAALTPDEKTRLTRNHTVDPVAYDLYLQGKFYAQQFNATDNDRAIVLFEQAGARDAQFAPVYAALAYEYGTRANELKHSDDSWNRKAFVAAERCIELDPELADCYVARSTLLWTGPNHFPHASAIADLKHAIALNPNNDEAHQMLANIYNHIGLLEQARNELLKAQALNPGNAAAAFRLAVNLNYQGKYAEALQALGSTSRFAPVLWAYHKGLALIELGRLDEAEVFLRKAEQGDSSDSSSIVRAWEAVTAAAKGDRTRAEQKIAESKQLGKGFEHFHHTEYGIGSAYALMNRPDDAIDWLKRAANDGFPCYPFYAEDHNLDKLRGDPRFITFMTDLKAQWQHYEDTL